MESNLENYYLKPYYLWDKLSLDLIDEFKSNSICLQVKKGEMVYSEGSYPKGLYIIKSGIAKLYLISNEGKEHIIYLLSNNDMFGYRPLLCNDNSPVFVSAIDNCEIEMIDKDVFISCIHKYNELRTLFFYFFGNEFRVQSYRSSVYAMKSVIEKVAITLLILNQKFNTIDSQTELPSITRRDIANYTGITIETLSRQLKVLKNLKVITINGWRISIKNPKHLIQLANIES